MIFDIKSNVKQCDSFRHFYICEVGVNTQHKGIHYMSKSMWTCDGTPAIHVRGSVEKER